MVLTAIILLNLTTASTVGFIRLSLPPGLEDAVKDLDADCMVMSNAFTYLNYAGTPAKSHPHDRENLEWSIMQGQRIVFFLKGGYEKPDYLQDENFMSLQPKITQTEDYMILGRKDLCAPIERLDYAYIEYQNMQYRKENITLCPILPIEC